MKKNNFLLIIMLAIGFYSNTTNAQCTDGDIILNGSFETGDFTDWVVMDLAIPFSPQDVFCNTPLNTFGFLDITALDGNCFAGNGFDGEGPGQITCGTGCLGVFCRNDTRNLHGACTISN